METIYVITSGQYSDYRINAVFESKELADNYIASFNKGAWNEMDVEEWELNPNKECLKKGFKAFKLRMDKQGLSSEIEWVDSDYGLENGQDDGVSFTFDKSLMNCYCFAKDEKHAVKIANERRVQYLAMNSWGEKIKK